MFFFLSSFGFDKMKLQFDNKTKEKRRKKAESKTGKEISEKQVNAACQMQNRRKVHLYSRNLTNKTLK